MSAARATTVVLEPTLRGSGHSVLNAGILATLQRAFPDARIEFHGEASRVAHVRGHMSPEESTQVTFAAEAMPAPLLELHGRRAAAQLLRERLGECFAAPGIYSAMFSTVAEDARDGAEARRSCLHWLTILSAVSWPLVLFMALKAEPPILRAFGSQWGAAVPVGSWLAIEELLVLGTVAAVVWLLGALLMPGEAREFVRRILSGLWAGPGRVRRGLA